MRPRASTILCALLLATVATVLESRAAEAPSAGAVRECAAALSARRITVNTVVARLRVTVHNRIKNQDVVLNGTYLGDAAGNLRLRITTEGGQLALDMGVRGEAVDICIPDKELFLSGTRQDLLNHPRCQFALLAHCGGARDLFFPEAPRGDTRIRSCRIGERAYFTPRRSWLGLPLTRRVAVNLSQNVVERTSLFTRFGGDAGRVVYSNYRFPEADATTPAYPGRVTLHIPGGEYVLDLDVDNLSLNTPIAAAKFAVPAPAAFPQQQLSAALRKKTAVWR